MIIGDVIVSLHANGVVSIEVFGILNVNVTDHVIFC